MNAPLDCRGIAFNAIRRGFSRLVPAVVLATAVLSDQATAQLCVQLNGAIYKQDFNTLPQSGTSNNSNTLPIGFAFSEAGSGNNITYAASDGSSSTNNTYSYGTTGNSDRAFGELGGALQSTLGACFVNNTGFVIPSLSIIYTGEQWRLGAADGNTDKLDFQFSTDATALNDEGTPQDPVTWTNVNSLDFSSPTISGSVGALNGNAAANRTSFGPIALIPSSGIPFGATFFIRWLPTDLKNGMVDVADDGLSIDDFTITYAPSADFDQDQDVDGNDFLRIQRGVGTRSGASVSIGDANKDGAVDELDSFFWRRQFGTTRDAPAQSLALAAAVPEPCGHWLIVLGATLTGAGRRWRRL